MIRPSLRRGPECMRASVTEGGEYPSRSERSEREYGVSCPTEGFRRGGGE